MKDAETRFMGSLYEKKTKTRQGEKGRTQATSAERKRAPLSIDKRSYDYFKSALITKKDQYKLKTKERKKIKWKENLNSLVKIKRPPKQLRLPKASLFEAKSAQRLRGGKSA